MEEFVVDNYTEPVLGMQIPGPTVIKVHNKGECYGPHCVIHNPSEHHMREWLTNWRADRNMMERICPHGVGHPDPDNTNSDTTHGCDGCCNV